ncbi:MAG TPA: 16S rRNA (guanine(527)-N(7))-methyltransferase RsmG [Vicinamibacterales bacterium]
MATAGTLERLLDHASRSGISIDEAVRVRLVSFYDLLQRWNRTINLTSLRNPDEAFDRLLLEPLVAAKYLAERPYLMDIGSGGGSPAIPLALALRPLSLVMVESNLRKAAFLREAIRHLEIPAATVVTSRFEDLPAEDRNPPLTTLITVRAVKLVREQFAALERLLGPNGRIALFSNLDQPQRLSEAAGLRVSATYDLVPSARSTLVILERD